VFFQEQQYEFEDLFFMFSKVNDYALSNWTIIIPFDPVVHRPPKGTTLAQSCHPFDGATLQA
jgi:hypothetical protein